MPFKPTRIENCYELITHKKVSQKVKDVLDYYEVLASSKKADAIAAILADIKNEQNGKILNEIMACCGEHCISRSTLDRAKRIYKGSKEISDFIDRLNAHHIGGGRLILKNNTITGGYDKCYCGSVSKAKNPIPIEYCSCSTGWYKRLFEETLNRKIKVTILKSIISGSKTCEFRIAIGKK